MRRIAQPWAAKVKIASRSFTWSMLAIVATHTPGLAGQCAALWHPSRWYILKPFISFPAGTLSVTADINVNRSAVGATNGVLSTALDSDNDRFHRFGKSVGDRGQRERCGGRTNRNRHGFDQHLIIH